MDVNGTRFHLLLTARDWMGQSEIAAPTISIDEGDEPQLEWLAEPPGLTLARRGFLFSGGPGAPLLEPSSRRGSDRDEFGTWYTIDESRTAIVQMLADGSSQRFWPGPASAPATKSVFAAKAEPSTPLELRGLAVTSDHRLAVGAPELPGLLVFDLFGGGSPIAIAFPEGFDPIDMVAPPDGGLFILDGGTDTPLYWCLDRWLSASPEGLEQAEPGPFVPKTPSPHPPATVAPRVTESGAVPIDVPDPRAISLLGDGTILVLGHGIGDAASTLYRYDGATMRGEPISLAGALAGFIDDPDARTDVVGHDIAVVANDGLGTLFVTDAGGDQAFAFSIAERGDDLDVEVLPTYYPMRLHHGRGLVAAGDGVYFDTLDRWHLLTPHGRQRHTAHGVYTSAVFDGQEPGCVWHRIFVDGCIPAGSSVVLETRAAEHPDDLATTRWKTEPALYRRGFGSELAHHRPTPDSDASGTWESLLQDATGRFLQFRLTLTRSGPAPPHLTALRLYFPRFGYRDAYLPEVYGENARSAELIDRYLANPEGLLTALEGRIAHAEGLFDHRTVPDEYLDWLASWLGTTLRRDWEPRRKRVFLDHANELFTWRGTIRGLTAAIRLAIDEDPTCAFESASAGPFAVRVVEDHATRTLGTVALGDPAGASDPVLVDVGDPWVPQMGSAVLQSRFAAFVMQRRPAAPASNLTLSPTTPTAAPQDDEWSDFLAVELGVHRPSFTAADLPAYRRYLVQKYTRYSTYSTEYGPLASGSSFETISLPTTLPESGSALRDWVELITRVLPISRQAHRFSVMVPVPLQASDEDQRLLLARVSDVVATQRPSHTVFAVHPFWAALRVGTARVGFETEVGRGSRFVPLIVGRGRLAKSYVPGGDRYERRMVIGHGRSLSSLPSNQRGTPS